MARARNDTPPPAAAGDRLQALQMLSETTSGLPGEAGVEAWLGRILATMVRLAGAAAGAVRVVTGDGRHLRLVASAGLPPEAVAREKLMPSDCGACGVALRDAQMSQAAAGTACARITSVAWFGGTASMVVVPLAHQGRVLGVYNLYLREARALPEEMALLYRSMGEHLGMALENARLARENLRITVMNERQMMAAEVHDSLAQTLAYMKMRIALLIDALRGAAGGTGADDAARALKYAADLQGALGEAYADLRELLAQFRSRMDPLGLAHALEGIAAGFADRTGVALGFENRLAELNLSVEEEAHVFHILQEALANVGRHSGATRAQLLLEERAGEYLFSVEDDGVGFFTLGQAAGSGDQAAPRHQLGVNIMRERAQRMAGRIEIANLPRRGARVRLVLPADPAARAPAA
ncbi:MAG: GAF domain-containing protein [Burkholderiales bacterium]|nr:GAF domain-containing protein [Burkholderiales bacterium]